MAIKEVEVYPVVRHPCGIARLAGQRLARKGLYVVIVHAGEHRETAQQEAYRFE